MHELVIRNGTLIDGTGAARRLADVAVDGGRITAVGDVPRRGKREIDAGGLLVTPGFVDIHTHYDGQATWDSTLTPSSWHGVTTAIFGNCGVGFAPVKPGTTDFLINLMEGVEDIPGTVLNEGVTFNWESFPEYLEELERRPRTMDIGAQVPHAALRFYVMGERGADYQATPTEAEAARMGELLEEALRAGAFGFSTSRTTKHKARDGRLVPTLSADEPELFALALAMKRAGRGVLEVNSDWGQGEFEILRDAARLAGRPLSCLLLQYHQAPERWRDVMAGIVDARREGIEVSAQVATRPVGIIMSLDTTVNPFGSHPTWVRELEPLPHTERVARLRGDAALRERLLAEEPRSHWLAERLANAYPVGDVPDYEPAPEQSVAAMARTEGRTLWAKALDLLLDNDGKGLLMHPFENYHAGNMDVVREMLVHPFSVVSGSDAGAHVGTICDASSPTSLLVHWGRDRRRGQGLDLEFVVHKQTRGNALSYGLTDRGVVAPGMRADLNIIDFDRLQLRRPEVVADLPAGGRRFIQRATGYRHTFVAGVETLRDDELTGELPGRLLRAGTQETHHA